jgi:hypothetical protein
MQQLLADQARFRINRLPFPGSLIHNLLYWFEAHRIRRTAVLFRFASLVPWHPHLALAEVRVTLMLCMGYRLWMPAPKKP